jgi:hypothetical protein
VFEITGEQYTHDVQQNHLCLRNASRYGKDGNAMIFEILGIDKCNVAEKSYGYRPTVGIGENDRCWPESVLDDFPAITRLVCYLYDYIESRSLAKKAKPSVKVSPPRKANMLAEGDIVCFILHDDDDLKYQVKNNHLEHSGGTADYTGNEAIFDYLSLGSDKKHEWASRCYNYSTNSTGVWPCSRHEDFAALTRFVDDIQRVLKEVRRLIDEDEVDDIDDIDVWSIITDSRARKKETPEHKVNIDDDLMFNQNKLQHGNEIKISAITPTVVRGAKRRGRTIRGKKCRTTIELGYLSHTAITG